MTDTILRNLDDALTTEQLDQALADGLSVEHVPTDSFYYGPLGKTFINGWFLVTQEVGT